MPHSSHRRRLSFSAAALLAAALCCAPSARAQRIQFPSAAPGGAPGAPPSTYAQPYAQPTYPQPTYPQPTYGAPPSAPAPSGGSWAPYGTSAGSVPNTLTQAAPPASSWDPYAPGHLQPPTITSPVAPPAGATPYGYPAPGTPGYGAPPGYPGGPVPYGAAPLGAAPNAIWPTSQYKPIRFINELRLDETFLAGSGGTEFQINDVATSASFAFPFFSNPAPLLITPGFTFHFWQGPGSGDYPGTPPPDLPPRAYDAYLEASWKPVVTPWLTGDLAASFGVYSDFTDLISQSYRARGRGVAYIQVLPAWQGVIGVWYLNRNDIKLLPVMGAVWTPGPNFKVEAVFPYPKATMRLTRYGNTDWFVYVRAEYGGGAWTVERENGDINPVDYNDYRAALGLEFVSFTRLKGALEVGYAWNREILYFDSTTPDIGVKDTIMFRGYVTY